MGDVFVRGVGMTTFGPPADIPSHALGAQAARSALDDAGVDWPDVGLVVVGAMGGGLGAGPTLVHELAWTGVPAFAVENASATGSAALAQACAAIAAGTVEVALAVGFGSLARHLQPGAGSGGSVDWATVTGAGLAPIPFALLKRRRMDRYGEPDEAALSVVAKNLHNAASNPVATRRRAASVAELAESPMLVDPLRRAECCPIGDGGAAVLVAARPDPDRRPVRISASVFGTDQWHQAASVAPDPGITARIAARAYRTAGVGPDDLDVVEVHDAFSVEELQYLEDLGLAAPGEAGLRLAAGEFAIGGRVATSPSGGLLARGHPGGATGLAQVVELVTQLRGEAGERQHPAARIGLAQMIGAGGVCYVHILEGEQ